MNEDHRTCTCDPDDRPEVCPRKFAAGECATPPASDAAVPAGFVLVPVEPTQAIVDAMEAVDHPNNHAAFYCDLYAAAIAAAPKVASEAGAGS